MNIVAVSLIATPIFGALGGAMTVKGSNTLTSVSALLVGALLGIGLVAGMQLAARRLSDRAQAEFPNWLAALFVVFLIPMSLPIVAIVLSHFVVLAGVHL